MSNGTGLIPGFEDTYNPLVKVCQVCGSLVAWNTQEKHKTWCLKATSTVSRHQPLR